MLSWYGREEEKSRGKYCPGSEDSSGTPEPEKEEGKRKALRWERGPPFPLPIIICMVISYRYSIALPSKEKLAILKKKKSSFGQEFCMASTGKYDSVVKTV